MESLCFHKAYIVTKYDRVFLKLGESIYVALTVSSQFGDKSMESQSGSSSKLFIHFAVLVDKGLGKRLSLALQDCHMCHCTGQSCVYPCP